MVFCGLGFGLLRNGLQRGVGNIHGGSGFKISSSFRFLFLGLDYIVGSIQDA